MDSYFNPRRASQDSCDPQAIGMAFEAHAAAKAARKIFTLRVEHYPRPINIATHSVTRIFASAATHPLNLRTKRQLAQFDASKLHILVFAKAAASKGKAFVRSHAVHRVRAQLFEALREKGYKWDGTRKEDAAEVEAERPAGLSGAYCLIIDDLPTALNCDIADIRQHCEEAVDKMMSDTQRRAIQAG